MRDGSKPPPRHETTNCRPAPANTTSGFSPDPHSDVVDLRADDWRF
jgi:hypothetical protein